MAIESGADSTKAITLRLYSLRDDQVILDRDLAALYGIPTGRLNMYVKRHIERFPEDFVFQLTPNEWKTIRALLEDRSGHGGARYRPHAFTEQGVMMLPSVMRGRRATAISIEILRAFARSRPQPATNSLDWSGGLLGDLERLTPVALELLEEERNLVTYFIQAGENGPIKIGVTADFQKRFRGLEMTSPVPLRVLGVVPMDIENESHVFLAEWRLHGEWFKSTREVLDFIQERLPPAPRVN